MRRSGPGHGGGPPARTPTGRYAWAAAGQYPPSPKSRGAWDTPNSAGLGRKSLPCRQSQPGGFRQHRKGTTGLTASLGMGTLWGE